MSHRVGCRLSLRLLAAEFLRGSNAHQYGTAYGSAGRSNRYAHIAGAQHGTPGAADVSTLPDLDDNC